MASADESQFDDDASQLMDDGSQPSEPDQSDYQNEREDDSNQDKSGDQEESATSMFESSVAVRQSIFDRRISIWRDPYTIIREMVGFGEEGMSHVNVEVSPDCSKIVVYDRHLHNILLFNTATLERIAGCNIGDTDVYKSFSFSSDGKRIMAPVALGNSPIGVLIIEIVKEDSGTSLLAVKRLSVNGCSHIRCRFMPGDNSKVLIRKSRGESETLFLYDLSIDKRIWKITNVFDDMFEFTKDASKILLSTYTNIPNSKEIERKDLILVDASTGEVISRTLYPAKHDIDCAVFSDDETRLVISMDHGKMMQIMSLPSFAVVPMSVFDMSGKFQTDAAVVTSMILPPSKDLVLRVEEDRLSIVDLRKRRMVDRTIEIPSTTFNNGIRVSSDESMILCIAGSDVGLMHVKSFAERLLMRILVMCIAQGRSRRRLPFIPSEVWHMIAERFLGIEAVNFLQ